MSDEGDYFEDDDDITPGWAQVPNFWMRDPRLTYKAKGLMSYIKTHTRGYKLTVAQMIAEGEEGKSAVYAGLRELVKHGYLTRKQGRGISKTGKAGFGKVKYSFGPAAREQQYIRNWPLLNNAAEDVSAGQGTPKGNKARKSRNVSAGQSSEAGASPDQVPGKDEVCQKDVSAGQCACGFCACTDCGSTFCACTESDTKKTSSKKTSSKNTTTPSAAQADEHPPAPPVVPAQPREVVGKILIDEQTNERLERLAREIQKDVRVRWAIRKVQAEMVKAITAGMDVDVVMEHMMKIARDPESRQPTRINTDGYWDGVERDEIAARADAKKRAAAEAAEAKRQEKAEQARAAAAEAAAAAGSGSSGTRAPRCSDCNRITWEGVCKHCRKKVDAPDKADAPEKVANEELALVGS